MSRKISLNEALRELLNGSINIEISLEQIYNKLDEKYKDYWNASKNVTIKNVCNTLTRMEFLIKKDYPKNTYIPIKQIPYFNFKTLKKASNEGRSI